MIYQMLNYQFFKHSFFPFKVTADGSIDCSDNPEDQENTVARLKWCEAIVALSILGNGIVLI